MMVTMIKVAIKIICVDHDDLMIMMMMIINGYHNLLLLMMMIMMMVVMTNTHNQHRIIMTIITMAMMLIMFKNPFHPSLPFQIFQSLVKWEKKDSGKVKEGMKERGKGKVGMMGEERAWGRSEGGWIEAETVNVADMPFFLM